MFDWEKELQQNSLARRVDQIEEDTNRGVNFLGLKVLYAEPSRTFGGMIVYADGTTWNPGSGEGFYRRNKANSGWVYTTSFGTVTIDESGYLRGGQTDYATGTGFFLGYSGGAYKFSIGSATKYLRWDGSSLSLRGDITGDSSINITGTANFGGATDSGGVTYAIVGNESDGSTSGVLGYSGAISGKGVVGSADHSGAYGVWGIGTVDNTSGVRGEASHANSVGVYARNTDASGYSLQIAGTGLFRWSSYTYAPPDGTTKLLAADGTWDPPSTLDVDKVDGYDAGNSAGQVAVSNGTVCSTLNADKLDGYNAGNASGDVPISNGTKCTNLYAALAEALYNGGNNYALSGTPTTGAATATFPGTDKPGSNSSVQWLTLAINGGTYYLPVWT